MSSIILSPGIFLPNGEFVTNRGDGHAKNAKRICQQYPELWDIMIRESTEDFDVFALMAGFSILASYERRDNWCLKVAKDNTFPEILKLKEMYQKSESSKNYENSQVKGVDIWDYWNINHKYMSAVKKISELVQVKNLYSKRGFLLFGRNWYPNDMNGYNHTATVIIAQNNWSKEWLASGRDAHDFLVLRKGAVQLGASIYDKILIAAKEFYTDEDLEAIKLKHRLRKYEHQLI